MIEEVGMESGTWHFKFERVGKGTPKSKWLKSDSILVIEKVVVEG